MKIWGKKREVWGWIGLGFGAGKRKEFGNERRDLGFGIWGFGFGISGRRKERIREGMRDLAFGIWGRRKERIWE